jgi:hypothetical protein
MATSTKENQDQVLNINMVDITIKPKEKINIEFPVEEANYYLQRYDLHKLL